MPVRNQRQRTSSRPSLLADDFGNDHGEDGAPPSASYAKVARPMDADKVRKYPMAGQPWSQPLDLKLAKDSKAGVPIKEMAKFFGRSDFAIRCRLERHLEMPHLIVETA